MESLGGDILEVLALGDGDDQLVRRREGGLDRLDRHGTSRTDGRGHARKEDDIPEGEHG